MKGRGLAAILLALLAGLCAARAEGDVPPDQVAPVTKAPITMSPVVSAGEAMSASAVPAPPALQWRITRPEWSTSDERAFGDFVRAIGRSDCRTVAECLSGPANIYRNSDPAGLSFFADCADLPYMLRAYFAWKNGLPFSYASAVAANGNSTDLRYSARGNHVVLRTDVTTPAPSAFPNARIVFLNLINSISTAMYRVPPGERQGALADFYPVRIAPGSIRPGTVIYDPNGHAATVYDVDDEGRIRFIDSHPDNSVSRGDYGHRFVRASPPMGAGFKNWRPLVLLGATQAPDGSYVGGVIQPRADSELADWSDEQFFGNAEPKPAEWRKARFVHKGETVDYYDYVRRAVAGHDIVYDPIVETRSLLKGLCDDLHYRVMAVDIAVKAGINRQPQPGRLPDNIYGTSGDWETYSTPSRDARLKTSFLELKDQVAKFLEMARQGSKNLAYSGSDLAGDLAATYREAAAACPVSYQASDGSMRTLSFEDARQRLFAFSFDPYHCPERRWGASSGAELATCRDDRTKTAWYAAQQRLRNQIERTYDAKMGFSLAELEAGAPGSGRDAPPDIDTLALIGRSVNAKAAEAAPLR
ncbi:MAG: hypothetical protein WBG82_02535 [Parvibaculum sp.]|uniref:hypothetical protein n=1 Tax=Parvibaculum sp. TaxID=2024848 RepID=UPI003C753154